MSATQPATETVGTHCPHCGAWVNDWSDFFCGDCGRAQYPDPYAAIFAAPIPTPRVTELRLRANKEIAAAARALFKDLGMRGLHVTSLRRSSHIRVSLPRIDHAHDHSRYVYQCPTCARCHAARQRVERILVNAFPDTCDRSDVQTDYFDFVWLVS